jgi:TolB protein
MTGFLWCFSLVLAGAGPAGQIAYVSGTEQEDQCVCIVDLSCGAVSRIGAGSRDGRPVWSPDGSKLAFSTSQPDGLGICIGYPDGAAPRRLAHARKWNRNPRWSPDGAFLAYEADDGQGFDHQIVVNDVNAGTESTWAGGKTGVMRPVWLPNARIFDIASMTEDLAWRDAQDQAVVNYEPGNSPIILAEGLTGPKGKYSIDLFLVTPASLARLMPQNNYVEWAAEPSPDGRNIAFESNDGGDREIFLASRTGVSDVTNHRAADWNPSWSSDSEWLAFESFRDGRRGVYRVHAGTARVSPVATDTISDNWSPSWSPDGKWIVFVSNRTGNPDIFVASPTGDDVKRITDSPGSDLAPAWRPEVKR